MHRIIFQQMNMGGNISWTIDGNEFNILRTGLIYRPRHTATNPPYNLGRTCTHEIGHYFNLEHLWGPNANSCCNEDDGVADTPNSCEDYLSECPSGTTFSCTAPDMWMNFMNYTDDACMAMFSLGQKLRMYDALNNFRAGLLNSDGCQSVATDEELAGAELRLFGNPATERLDFEIKSSLGGKWQVKLVSALGQPVFDETKMANTAASIYCQGFSRGFYFLVASQNETRIVRRVVLF